MDGALRGMNFTWQGQSCGSTSRLYVHRMHFDRFVDDLGRAMDGMRQGDPLDETTDVGPVVSRRQFDKVKRYLAGARDATGVRLIAGGQPTDGQRGFFVRPTLYTIEDEGSSALACEEIFGPVLVAMAFDDYEDVINRANALSYGLTASVWTRSLETAFHAARDLECWQDYPEQLDDDDWESDAFRRSHVSEINALVGEYTRAATSNHLVSHLQASGMPCLPVNRPTEYMGHPQSRSRGFMVERPRNEAVAFRHLLPIMVDGSRPRGTHDRGVEAAAAATTKVPAIPVMSTTAAATASRPGQVDRPPLTGLRVVALTTGIAGPLASRYLASMGADVIKIESEHGGVDSFRYFGIRPGLDSSLRFSEMNTNVRSVALNLKHERGRSLAIELAAISDVVIENFRPGVLEKLGVGAEVLRSANPRLIIARLPGLGSTGPLRSYSSWGPTLSAFTGMTWLWNHPGRPHPVGHQGSYPDYVAAAFAAVGILAALLGRRKEDAGCEIELAQSEAASFSIGATLSVAATTRTDPAPAGNRCAVHAPCGVFPCKGVDAWVAVSVTDDPQWTALCGVLGIETDRRRYATSAARNAAAAEVEEMVASHTGTWSNERLAETLQAAGIAASAVATGRELAVDPQLKHRRFIRSVDQPGIGRVRLPAAPLGLPSSRVVRLGKAPSLGEHSRSVVCGLLGHSDEDFARWMKSGAIA